MRLSRIIQTGALGAMLSGVVLVACYSPDIGSGDLQCSASPENKCPRGFTCDLSMRLCVKSAPASGMGGTAGAGGAPGTGGVGGMCVTPVPGCASAIRPGAACDEVCQVGCACDQRCSLSGLVVACQADTGGRATVGEACSGGGVRDNCAPGLVCLEEPEPVCGNRCFRYCTDDKDCSQGAHCSSSLVVGGKEGEGIKVCDVPPDDCNPIFGETKCKRADRPDTYGCYLMGSDFPNATVCDCAGVIQENAPCTLERGCEPGLICARGIDQTVLCRKVCPLEFPMVIGRVCGMGRSCIPFAGSNRWGTCQ